MALRFMDATQGAAIVRTLLAMAFTVSALLGGAAPAVSQSSEIDLKIGAPIGSSVWVTTDDGTHLGSCTVPDNGGTYAPSCSVPVPHPSTVLIHLDESTIPSGSVVQANPISFDTTLLHGRDSWGGAPSFGINQSTSSDGGYSDIAIATTANGTPFYDACFVLVDYSNEGCDMNRDGDITFDAIPHGTYTLRQTRDLGSGGYVADTTITVSGAADADTRERFHVSVQGSSGDSSYTEPVDISLITRDPANGELLRDACYVLVDHSNEGCDENQDGQVTFAAIPPGTYTVRQTKTPDGYPAINDYEITVDNVDGVPLGFLVRQSPEQNAPETRNVSIVFVDIDTHTRLVSDICVQLIGASNVGCDEDLRDGQVDFLDVPAGEWEYEFSNVPDGWVIDPEGRDFGPFPPLVVDSSPEEPSHLIRFIPVALRGANVNQPQDVEMYSLHIRSMTATEGTTLGTHFTVSSEDGTVLGSCTLEGDATSPPWQYCSVDVPVGIVVTVWQDPSSLPDGLVAEENPIQFDTTYPTTTPHSIDVAFMNVPG